MCIFNLDIHFIIQHTRSRSTLCSLYCCKINNNQEDLDRTTSVDFILNILKIEVMRNRIPY